MDRSRKTKQPCPTCFLNPSLCLCALIEKLDLKTRVTLVIHVKELKRTTNTGRLALAALVNSEMIVRGEIGKPLDLTSVLDDRYEPLLFYPAQDAIKLSDEFVATLTRPVQLLVPDGNWRQAGKIHYGQTELAHVRRVKISAPNQGEHHLRAEHMPEGMSTLEAIAHAITKLEGVSAGHVLLALYNEKLKRTLIGRGVL
jgi:DTW domain-containing protein YfiP